MVSVTTVHSVMIIQNSPRQYINEWHGSVLIKLYLRKQAAILTLIRGRYKNSQLISYLTMKEWILSPGIKERNKDVTLFNIVLVIVAREIRQEVEIKRHSD